MLNSFINMVSEVQTTAIRQEEKKIIIIKWIKIGKEKMKLSLLADDIMLCIENPKDATRKPLELINEICKTARFKINIQKSIAFLR